LAGLVKAAQAKKTVKQLRGQVFMRPPQRNILARSNKSNLAERLEAINVTQHVLNVLGRMSAVLAQLRLTPEARGSTVTELDGDMDVAWIAVRGTCCRPTPGAAD
jgi:hypothetical protein